MQITWNKQHSFAKFGEKKRQQQKWWMYVKYHVCLSQIHGTLFMQENPMQLNYKGKHQCNQCHFLSQYVIICYRDFKAF